MRPETMQLLLDLAKEAKLEDKIKDLFAGKHLNMTEDRAVCLFEILLFRMPCFLHCLTLVFHHACGCSMYIPTSSLHTSARKGMHKYVSVVRNRDRPPAGPTLRPPCSAR